MSKVCFITAIYGNYELSCKKFKEQLIPTDFICFTDNSNITNNGWIIDTTPYHFNNKSPIDNKSLINSFKNNIHIFNICKYYKQAFQNIPRLKEYDVIIWLDGTIEITNENTSKWILDNIYKHKIIGWEHNHEFISQHRHGLLLNEVNASQFFRYTSTFWNNQSQPYQDVLNQYSDYIDDGYDENYFKSIVPSENSHNFGVWLTCFVAFLNKDQEVTNFLNMWYLQTLKYTTQDQIGFPYVVQKTNLIPYTLPNNHINGNAWLKTDFYIKHPHNL